VIGHQPKNTRYLNGIRRITALQGSYSPAPLSNISGKRSYWFHSE